MTKYLLLRDNKESGPYAFNELREKGLKAYDLVWIEGKSAAWRYPSEVEELKPFAPAVEEQPFDRFYKKPLAGQTGVAAIGTAPVATGGAVVARGAVVANFNPEVNNAGKIAAETMVAAAAIAPAEDKTIRRVTAPSVVIITSASAINTSSEAVTDSSKYIGEPSAVPGKRIIYVTLPSGRPATGGSASKPASGPVAAAGMAPREMTAEAAAYAMPGNTPVRTTTETPTSARSEASTSARTAAISVTEASLRQAPIVVASAKAAVQPVGELDEDNYTQSGNDWKRHVEISPRPARQRMSRFLQPLAVALCIIALLAAGIFIGLSINKDTFPLRQKLAVTETTVRHMQQVSAPVTPAIQPPPAAVLPSTPPVGNDPAPQTSVNQTSPAQAPDAQTPLAQTPVLQTQQGAGAGNPGTKAVVTTPVPSVSVPGSALVVKKSNTGKDKSGLSKNQALAGAAGRDSGAVNIPVVHREASHQTDPAVEKPDKDLVRSNLSSLVSVGASNYTVGTFGGISDLQVTVSNRSVYPLDLVVVEVQYVQSNKKVFKTENLYFRGIGAGSALMQEAPKSPRGIKVQYKITAVNSKEWGLSYSAL